MKMIDHSNTMVLLVGASSFPQDDSIPPIPNVAVNIRTFIDSLTNADIVGIPRENIVMSLDESPSEIEVKLYDLSEKTNNKKFTLLVYYTGHGMFSTIDGGLYLTTQFTRTKYLEVDSIRISRFKDLIKRSKAGRKIVILDCCHSGNFIGRMNNLTSAIAAEVKDFHGMYIMTSAAENAHSSFPAEEPHLPTYFTGKLLSLINDGLEIDSEYCSLRNIFNELESALISEGLPRPQQLNSNQVDEWSFFRNKKFGTKLPPDELRWTEISNQQNKWVFVRFTDDFPSSQYVDEAFKRIQNIEEEEEWVRANLVNTYSALRSYISRYPTGKYVVEANNRILALEREDEEKDWDSISGELSSTKLAWFLKTYPNGVYAKLAREKIEEIKRLESTKTTEPPSVAFVDETYSDKTIADSKVTKSAIDTSSDSASSSLYVRKRWGCLILFSVFVLFPAMLFWICNESVKYEPPKSTVSLFDKYDYHQLISSELANVKLKDKWGRIGRDGKVIIPLLYDTLFDAGSELIAAKQEGKWGFLDQAGKQTISFKYNDVLFFAEGICAVREARKWGGIDTKGALLIPYQFDTYFYFSEGLASVLKDSVYGYIDKKGRVIAPFKFDSAGPFLHDSAKVVIGKRVFFINSSGSEIIKPK